MSEDTAEPPDNNASTTCFLTLVNGTFAPRAKWVDPESDFSRGVLSASGKNITIRSFRWSGSNSFKKRRKAGLLLARELRAITLQQAQLGRRAKHLLIGHSHGGTVCAYAAQACGKSTGVSGILFLSTPFLHLSASIPYLFTAILLTIVLVLGASIAVFGYLLDFLGASDELKILVFAHVLLIVLYLWSSIGWSRLNSMAKDLERYSMKEAKLPSCSICFASGDEVSMLMGFSAAIDYLLDFITSITFLASRWTWASGFFLAIFLASIERAWGLFVFAAFPAYFGVVSILYCIRLMTSFRFGWDAPLVCSVLKCRSEIVPYSGRFLEVAMLPSSNFLLSGSDDGGVSSDEMLRLDHSSQDDIENALPVVLRWLEKQA